MPRLLFLLAVLSTGCAAGQQVNASALSFTSPPTESAQPSQLSALWSDDTYTVGPADVLTVRAYDLEEAGKPTELDLVVNPEGVVTLPLVGACPAAGHTLVEIEAEIARRLGRYVRQPEVQVTVAEYRSQRIAVLGAVKEPGLKALERRGATVAEAIALAGGTTSEAGIEARLLRRAPGGRLQAIDISLEGLDDGMVRSATALRKGDVLQVFPAPTIHVAGYVEKPGEFRLRQRTTVLGAVALAGGVQIPAASPSMTVVRRRCSDGSETFLRVDLVAISDGSADDLVLEAGDIVEVQQSAARYIATGAYDFFRGFVNVGLNLASLF